MGIFRSRGSQANQLKDWAICIQGPEDVVYDDRLDWAFTLCLFGILGTSGSKKAFVLQCSFFKSLSNHYLLNMGFCDGIPFIILNKLLKT